MTSRGVIVAHPGVQHSYETALGVQSAGMLQRFITGLYCKRGGIVRRAAKRLLRPAGWKLESQLRRRRREELDERLITTLPFGETSYLLATRLGLRGAAARSMVMWRNKRFAKAVSRIAAREAPAAVLCYDTSALRTFEAAKMCGAVCILDQSIGLMRHGLEILKQELAMYPRSARPRVAALVDERMADLCDREIEVADLILAPSEYVRDGLVSAGVEPNRIALLPYGADVERIVPAHGKRDGKQFRVLFVGEIGPRKGIGYLLEAMKQLHLADAELVLVGALAGCGDLLKRYSEHVTLVGKVSREAVARYLPSADIFVFPALHEGSARVTYEALAAGLPAVTTPNSGSVVRDGIDGFIVPIRDVEALKEKILLLYEDRELRMEMSIAARRRAEQFSWTAYRRRLGEILRGRLPVTKPCGFVA